jgi:hypothetical protein
VCCTSKTYSSSENFVGGEGIGDGFREGDRDSNGNGNGDSEEDSDGDVECNKEDKGGREQC